MEEIKRVRKGNRTESDHILMKVELIGPQTNRRGRKTEVEIKRSNWTEEGVKNYQEKCEGWTCNDTEDIWKK